MTRDEAIKSVENGIELARSAAAEGIELLGIGEMGIGNTTAASAIAATLTESAPEAVTGYGAGVDDAGLQRKIAAVKRALEINRPDRADALDVLAKVGGAEIGVMAGVALGAAAERIPVVADGFISTSAAALACVFCPNVRDYLFIGHRSRERGHDSLIEFVGQRPLLDLQMRLGEGTGAALAMHIIGAAARLLGEMATFAEAGVSDRESIMAEWLRLFLTAIQFLTRLPVPKWIHVSEETLGKATKFFPLVGVIVGAGGALTFWLLLTLAAAIRRCAVRDYLHSFHHQRIPRRRSGRHV